MLIGGINSQNNSFAKLQQRMCFLIKRVDAVVFFVVAILLWASLIPKLSRSRHLPQPDRPIFNNSYVYDNSSERYGVAVKGNHLSYAYATWDAESLRRVNDVELFLSAYFDALPVAAFSCWRPPCTSLYSLHSFPKLIWSHNYGTSNPGSFERYPRILQKAKRIYNPIVQANTCSELKVIVTNHEFTIVGRIDASPQPSALYLSFHEFATRVSSGPDNLSLGDHFFSLSKDFAFVVMATQSDSCFLNSTFPVHVIFRSGRVIQPLDEFSYSNSISVNNATEALYKSLQSMVLSFRSANMLTLSHVSTAFPTAYNLSSRSPLIILFTDSQIEPDSFYNADTYLFKSIQLEYSMCATGNETAFPIPSLSEQQNSLYRTMLDVKSKKCRTAVVCPIWWRRTLALSNQTQSTAWLTCGLDKSHTPSSNDRPLFSFSHSVSFGLKSHPARKDIVNLAAHLLDSDLNPYEKASEYTGVDGTLAVRTLNRQCCEFAVIEATERVGIFNTSGVRKHAFDLIRGKVEPEYGRLCTGSDLINYAKTSKHTANITALGCRRWGNDSLTFITISRNNSPPWVRDLFGESKPNLPHIAIVDTKSEVVYAMNTDLTFDNVAAFIARFHNETLDRHFISNAKSFVKKPASTNFREADSPQHLQDLIEQEAKDVVVLFYGRHCGYTTHGRGALYEFRAVASHFANRESILFVVVDVDRMQLPWSLSVEHVPAVIFFPNKRKSNSIVFPQVLLASTDLFSNLVTFVKKHAEETSDGLEEGSTTTASPLDDSFRLVEHLRVHLNQIHSAEALLDNLLERLSAGLEEVNSALRMHTFQYIIRTPSGQTIYDRLRFTLNRLSSKWNHFKRVQERLSKERDSTLSVKAQLLANNL